MDKHKIRKRTNWNHGTSVFSTYTSAAAAASLSTSLLPVPVTRKPDQQPSARTSKTSSSTPVQLQPTATQLPNPKEFGQTSSNDHTTTTPPLDVQRDEPREVAPTHRQTATVANQPLPPIEPWSRRFEFLRSQREAIMMAVFVVVAIMFVVQLRADTTSSEITLGPLPSSLQIQQISAKLKTFEQSIDQRNITCVAPFPQDTVHCISRLYTSFSGLPSPVHDTSQISKDFKQIRTLLTEPRSHQRSRKIKSLMLGLHNQLCDSMKTETNHTPTTSNLAITSEEGILLAYETCMSTVRKEARSQYNLAKEHSKDKNLSNEQRQENTKMAWGQRSCMEALKETSDVVDAVFSPRISFLKTSATRCQSLADLLLVFDSHPLPSQSRLDDEARMLYCLHYFHQKPESACVRSWQALA